jgi:hypothetical protein
MTALQALALSVYEIELVSKKGPTVIGAVKDAVSALNFMDEAIRKFPTGHIRIRRATAIIAERLSPVEGCDLGRRPGAAGAAGPDRARHRARARRSCPCYFPAMTIVPVQCWIARTALGWTMSDLARAAGMSRTAVRSFERGDASRAATIEAIQRALEEAGVIFIDANEGGPGARLRSQGAERKP